MGFFGKALQEREEKMHEIRKEKGAIWKITDEYSPASSTPDIKNGFHPKPAPKVSDIIGKALPYIGTYKSLDNKQQKVALIDDVCCLFLLLVYIYSCIFFKFK